MRKKGGKFMTLKHDKWSKIVTLLKRHEKYIERGEKIFLAANSHKLNEKISLKQQISH